MAKLQRKVKPPGQEKRQAETAAHQPHRRQASRKDDARLLKITDSCYWREPLGQLSALDSRSRGDRPHRGSFVLGQAQAVKMTKPGEARLVKVSTKKPPSFNIDSLSSIEADLMSSAGAMARSSRRSSLRTDSTVPGAEDYIARPFTQPVVKDANYSGQDWRFRQLVRQLEANDHESNRHTGCALVPELSRVIPPREAASEQRSAVSAKNEVTKRTQFSPLEHKPGYFCLNDPTQRRTRVDDGSTINSASKIPANPNSRPGDSGCPSLISDDGREGSDAPGDTADDHAQTPTFQMPSGIPAWEKEEDTSTAPNGTPSEGSFTVVNISMDENELSSRADTDVGDPTDESSTADENTSSCGGHGWWDRDPRAVASPLSFHHDNFYSRLRQRSQHVRRTSTRQPNELELYPQCAMPWWLISTMDAPGTRGMRDESSAYWELLGLPQEYLPRYGDDARAQIWRVLRFLSDPEEPRPELSQEARAFLWEIYSQSMPQEREDPASVAQSLPCVDGQQPKV